MSRYDKLVQLKADIDDAIDTLTELLERYESLELDLDKTKKATGKLVFASDLSQEELDDLMDLYEDWEVGESVDVGDIRKYNSKLYRVIQAHTTQADWTPDSVPALWVVYTPPTTEDGEEIGLLITFMPLNMALSIADFMSTLFCGTASFLRQR